MAKILVSLISEHTIPNIICALHFKIDKHLFVTTERSEKDKRSEAIENVLLKNKIIHSPNDIEKIFVNQDDFSDCVKKLDEYLDKREDQEYIVNITGGTKIMALAVYEKFTKIGQKVKIVYIPLGKNDFLQLFPLKYPLKIEQINNRLTVEDYLLSYGFKIKNKESFHQAKNEAIKRKELTKFMLENFERLTTLFSFFYDKLNSKRDKQTINLEEEYQNEPNEIEKEVLNKCGFKIENKKLSARLEKQMVNFLTGGWLEEYVFSQVNELLEEKTIDDCLISCEIESHNQAKNEIDVCFIKDNTFYQIECKSMSEGEPENQILNNEIYKRDGLTTQLGLRHRKRAMICTTLKKIKTSLSNRAQDYDVEIFSREDTLNIKEKIKYKLQKG